MRKPSAVKKRPISGLRGAPPETSAFSRPPKPVEDGVLDFLEQTQPLAGVAHAAEGDGFVEQLFLRAASLPHALADALVQHLVEAGHGGHDRRARLDHVGAELLDALGIIDFGTDGDREELPGGMLIRMRQRQKRQERLLLESDFQERVARAHAVMHDRLVRQHDALGCAAGARRVDDAGGIVGTPALDQSDDVLVAAAAHVLRFRM
jgi:hypothetical protein